MWPLVWKASRYSSLVCLRHTYLQWLLEWNALECKLSKKHSIQKGHAKKNVICSLKEGSWNVEKALLGFYGKIWSCDFSLWTKNEVYVDEGFPPSPLLIPLLLSHVWFCRWSWTFPRPLLLSSSWAFLRSFSLLLKTELHEVNFLSWRKRFYSSFDIEMMMPSFFC